MRARVMQYDVTIGGDTFRVDAFDWRSAQIGAQKRYRDKYPDRRLPFVAKSEVVKVPRP